MARFSRIARAVGTSVSAALAAYRQASIPGIPPLPKDDEDYAVARERLIQAIVETARIAQVPPPVPGQARVIQASLNAEAPDGEKVKVSFQYVESDPHAIRLRYEHGKHVIKAITSRDAFLWALLGLPSEKGTRLQVTNDGEHFHLRVNHKAVEEYPPFKMVRFASSRAFQFIAATAALVPIGEETTDWKDEAEHLGADPSQFVDPSW